MSSYSAVASGTNLAQHARELARIHDAVLAGGTPTAEPRGVVARSWQRVLHAGLDASRANVRDPRGRDEVLRRRERSPLRLVIDDLVAAIGAAAEPSRMLLVVTDAEGVVLWRAGAAAVRSRADSLGFAEGAEWTEQNVGTNAIGTAIAEGAPVQLFSAEHFEQAQHPWYCSAHPLHDPRTGELLGVVDVSGPALTLHPAIGALVETSVRLAESQLWRHHEEHLHRLRTATEHVTATVAGPLLVVDDDGWVAHHAGVAARPRISVPRAGTALTVPGLGICLPERLGDGWLVRRGAGSRTIAAVLTIGRSCAIEVRSGAETWQAALTGRHAQILRALHDAGPAGFSAYRLSTLLYGDGDHLVTVRAEISRLRRLVGGLVEARPYRIADGVRLDVVESD